MYCQLIPPPPKPPSTTTTMVCVILCSGSPACPTSVCLSLQESACHVQLRGAIKAGDTAHGFLQEHGAKESTRTRNGFGLRSGRPLNFLLDVLNLAPLLNFLLFFFFVVTWLSSWKVPTTLAGQWVHAGPCTQCKYDPAPLLFLVISSYLALLSALPCCTYRYQLEVWNVTKRYIVVYCTVSRHFSAVSF